MRKERSSLNLKHPRSLPTLARMASSSKFPNTPSHPELVQEHGSVDSGSNEVRENDEEQFMQNEIQGQDKEQSPTRTDDGHGHGDAVIRAHITSLRLLFSAWLSHFSSLGYIRDSTMDLLDKNVLRTILQLSVKDGNARRAIGLNELVWEDISSLLRLAVPSLESRSYATIPDPYDTSNPPTATIYDGPSSNIIVLHHQSLLKDLQRMNNMLCIARNIITAGSKAQILCAQLCVDRELYCLVNLCVKITARGYDGDGAPADEEKWQAVVNEYKKLLITCLQFLSNMATLNEQLKLVLWVELFDSSSECNVPGWQDPATAVRPPLDRSIEEAEHQWITTAPMVLALGSQHFLRTEKKSQGAEQVNGPYLSTKERSETPVRKLRAATDKYPAPKLPHNMWLEENLTTLTDHLRAYNNNNNKDPSPQDLEAHAKKLFESWSEAQTAPYHERYKLELRDWCAKPEIGEVADLLARYIDTKEGRSITDLLPDSTETDANGSGATTFSGPLKVDGYLSLYPPGPVMETAEQGIRKLENGKRDLLERLDTHPHNSSQINAVPSPESPTRPESTHLADDTAVDRLSDDDFGNVDEEYEDDHAFASEGLEDDGEEDGDEDDEEREGEEEEPDQDGDGSSEDEYDRVPGEDGRGLLTDVPLILGPNEIEVLPMIIMSGIVTDTGQVNAKREEGPEYLQTFLNIYTLRCHLLLAKENGRNLLRELLIFVAAWDLREEELYFKFMVKIMESILTHGLMWIAYSAFKEKKDIISPAQAVIMKLLTKIFHSRQAFIRTEENGEVSLFPQLGMKEDPTVTVVRSLFSEFRSHIIPGICALICLQGQIRRGRASIEEFPLNLWDMERMYEGVYQYLEFFAILTDHEEWKDRMAEWEVVSELITLLRELEDGIGKRTLVRSSQQMQQPVSEHHAGPTLLTNHSQGPPPNSEVRQPRPVLGQIPPSPPGFIHISTAQDSDNSPYPVAIERPYSPLPETPTNPPTTSTSTPPQLLPKQFINTPPICPSARANSLEGHAQSPPLHEEPADFEWRNLKKLCVLVLSSLVWKNKTLQDQVLKFGGIETILRCCQHDEHNPYIREHAIMCLRFCLEDNDEVRDTIRSLAGQSDAEAQAAAGADEGIPTTIQRTDGVDVNITVTGQGEAQASQPETLTVPREVLDTHGYETFMDSRGQVGLRRKDTPGQLVHPFSETDPADADWNYTDEIFGYSEHDDNCFTPGNSVDIPASLRPGNGSAHSGLDALAAVPKPRSAADLPQWVEAITRDLPHRRMERGEACCWGREG